MNRICFDASAALAFAFQDDPYHAAAVALVSSLGAQGATLCAPSMFAYECDSVIRLRMWKGDLSPTEAAEARALVAALSVAVEYDARDSDRAFQIACDYDQPRAYDTAYAAHAEVRGLELVTTDKPFFEALNGPKRPKTAPPLAFVRLLT